MDTHNCCGVVRSQRWQLGLRQHLVAIKWSVYPITEFFIPFYKQLGYSSDHSPQFHAWRHKWHGLTQECALFGFGWYCSPFRGSNCPKTL